MDWSDINSDKNYHFWKVYEKSKLCNVLFTRELAKRLEGTRVTVNALHPGVVRTELSRHFNGWISMVLSPIFYPFKMFGYKTVHQGAQTNIFCAVSPDLEKVSGVYFADCKKEELLPHALNEEDAKKLWDLSEKLCKSFMN
jgi:retinol dehydrogenase-14